MRTSFFLYLLKNANGVRLNDDYILFKDFELWNSSNDRSVTFKNYDELLQYNFNGAPMKEFIEASDKSLFDLVLNGGRGAGSDGNEKMGGGFSHAKDSGGGDGELAKAKFPAEFNVGGKNRSYEKVLGLFQDKYKDADHEYAVDVSDDGFVYQHVEGGATSVGIQAGKNRTVIHNHPSGGNFSDNDLLSTALSSERGIVATGTKNGKTTTFTFRKGAHFKAKAFAKAVKSAKWPTKYNYDQGADWWLKKNASKYGYTYTSKF